MRTLFILLAVGVLFVGFGVPALVRAAPAFEDPQLCVDGMLLRVDPTTDPIDVFVRVGEHLSVDYDVANCGGDPSLPVVDPSQVTVGGGDHELQIRVSTAPKAKVVATFDGKTKLDKADKYGWAKIKFKVH